ncbi:MAG: hypothetical protein ABIN89_17040 [Chitinophagaceae bacterium]
MGRKNPIFYLILPLALQQGEAAFINQYIAIGGKYLLSPYVTIFIDVLFFLMIGIAVVLMKVRYKKVPWIGTTVIAFFLAYVFFLWLRSFLDYTNVSEVFLTGRQFMYISLSYFLWVAIFESVTREQYEALIKLMFYVTPISTVIYILNSSRIFNFYDASLIYLEVDYGTESFLRDFKTIPLWLIPILVLSIQSLLTTTIKIPRNLIIANILVLPMGILFTFTRSFLFIVMIQVAFLMVMYGSKLSGKIFRNLILFAGFISLSLVVVQKVFPSQANYFSERLLSAKKEGKSEQNVDIRIEYVKEASKIVNKTNPFLGAGMNRKYYMKMNAIGAWIADSTTPVFLMHTGWIGVLMIFGIVFIFFVDSFLTFIKTKDWLTGYLSAYFLALLISSQIMGEALSGNAWTLMNFALYSVIKFSRWKPSQEMVATEA